MIVMTVFLSKSKGKQSPRSYPIQFKRKWKHSFLSESFPRLSETLASLGIMRVQLIPPLKLLGPSQHYRFEELKGGPEFVPHYVDSRNFYSVFSLYICIYSHVCVYTCIYTYKYAYLFVPLNGGHVVQFRIVI